MEEQQTGASFGSNPYGRPWLCAAPVSQALQGRNLRKLAAELAIRFGTNPESEARQLLRIKSGATRSLCEPTADRFAAALGFHILDLWPDWR